MNFHHALNTPVLDDAYAKVTAGAHTGAYGANDLKTPSDATAQAGTYKMGRVTVQGLRIAIEQPCGSIRSGKGADGKEWSSRMAAHYGYFEGTRGADGDGIDCFVGPYPESEQVFVINQRNPGGGFDEHKVMLAFSSERHARGAYLDSYERGWRGLQSLVPISLDQLRWWIKHGKKSIALTAESLPQEGTNPMNPKITWNEAQPDSISLDQVLYQLRRMDGADGLLLDSVTMAEIMEDTDGVIALDALVVENAQLTRMAERLRAIMDRSGGTVKAPAVQVSEPFRARGVTNIAAVFELSDGQTVSVFFHNPDTAPNKLAPGDEMISWKWLLNKKDITIVVAPEKGQDLNPRLVSQRIMRLAEKNSPAFQKANAKRSERMGNIEAIRGRIAEKEATLTELVAQVEAARMEKDQRVIAAEDEARKTSYLAIEDASDEQLQYAREGLQGLYAGTHLAYFVANPKNPDMVSSSVGYWRTKDGGPKPTELVYRFDDVDGEQVRRAKSVSPADEADTALLKNGRITARRNAGSNSIIYEASFYVVDADGNLDKSFTQKQVFSSEADARNWLTDLGADIPDEVFKAVNFKGAYRLGSNLDESAFARQEPTGEITFNNGIDTRDMKFPSVDSFDAYMDQTEFDWPQMRDTWLKGFDRNNRNFELMKHAELVAAAKELGLYKFGDSAEKLLAKLSPEKKSSPIELVDAAYQFANATDAFKERVAGSIDKTDYSEFASAKAMDMKAKSLGAEIHWGMGAALDGVALDSVSPSAKLAKSVSEMLIESHGWESGRGGYARRNGLSMGSAVNSAHGAFLGVWDKSMDLLWRLPLDEAKKLSVAEIAKQANTVKPTSAPLLDGVSVAELGHAPAYTDGTGKWHSYTMEAMKHKDDAALRYIIKDATEAAEAGEKMNNPKAGQYRDEAHYASMELQRRRKGGKQIMDSVIDDDDDGDDFDPEAEFDACPVEDGDLDGDFKGHPFRGNQHKKASSHSHAAVRASMSAKHAEKDGDTKGAKSSHKSAHYSHMAAAEGTTGQARKYHRKMAKFHGSRAGMTLDGVEGWDGITDDDEIIFDSAYSGEKKFNSKTDRWVTTDNGSRLLIRGGYVIGGAGGKLNGKNKYGVQKSTFNVSNSRFAKGQSLVSSKSNDGYKTEAASLAVALGGRWTHREKGYVMPPSKVKFLEHLMDAGATANDISRTITIGKKEDMSAADAKKHLKSLGYAFDDASDEDTAMDSVTFDDASDFAGSAIVGKIMKGGQQMGRAVIGGDGKAMVFVGESDDQRVRFVFPESGRSRDAIWGDVPADMVEWLLVPAADPVAEAEYPTAPAGADEYLVKELARTKDLIDQLKAAGIAYLSTEQFMREVNSKNRSGYTIEKMKRTISEYLEQIAQVKSGVISPRKIMGVGATKAGAIKWLEDTINKYSIALEHDGFMVTINVSNYNYALRAALKGSDDNGFKSDEEIAAKAAKDKADQEATKAEFALLLEKSLKAKAYESGSTDGMKAPFTVIYMIPTGSIGLQVKVWEAATVEEKYQLLAKSSLDAKGMEQFKDKADFNHARKNGAEFGHIEVAPRKGYSLVRLTIDLAMIKEGKATEKLTDEASSLGIHVSEVTEKDGKVVSAWLAHGDLRGTLRAERGMWVIQGGPADDWRISNGGMLFALEEFAEKAQSAKLAMFKDASDEALGLLRISAQNRDGAYKSAVKVEQSADSHGMTVRWEAVSDTPALDDATGGLFGDGDSGYLCGYLAYNGKKLASIFVRGDGLVNFELEEVVKTESIQEQMDDEGMSGWNVAWEEVISMLKEHCDENSIAQDSASNILISALMREGFTDDGDWTYVGVGDLSEVAVHVVDTSANLLHWRGGKPRLPGEKDHWEFAANSRELNGLIRAEQGFNADFSKDEMQPIITEMLADAKILQGWVESEREKLQQERARKKEGKNPEPKAPADNEYTRLNAALKAAPKDREVVTSDDPEAIEKLERKLYALQLRQEFMKKTNKLIKKGDDAGLIEMGFNQGTIETMKKPDFAGRIGFPDFELTNNNGVISTTRKRLEELKRRMSETQEPTVTPDPAPAPAPTANAEDRAFFMSLIDGTHPNLDDPELVNNLEAAYQRNSEDAEMVSLFTQAINAYTTASLAETEGM